MLYVSVNNFSVISRHFTRLNQYLAIRKRCPAQGHNTVPMLRLEPGTSISQVELLNDITVYSNRITDGCDMIEKLLKETLSLVSTKQFPAYR